MERAAFLIEKSGERIPCLLNPASVVTRRVAGIRPRFSIGGPITGTGLGDNPLQFTGGGSTEIEMDLLFDVSLARSRTAPENVRELTEPLWRLAENLVTEGEYGRPPIVRFIWGKAWNIPGVVAAVAERLEHFTQAGTPRRSWLRLRMLRTAPEDMNHPPAPLSVEANAPWADWPEDRLQHYDVTGDGDASGDRPDAVAVACGYAPEDWPVIMDFNGIDDPMALAAGQTLVTPIPRSM